MYSDFFRQIWGCLTFLIFINFNIYLLKQCLNENFPNKASFTWKFWFRKAPAPFPMQWASDVCTVELCDGVGLLGEPCLGAGEVVMQGTVLRRQSLSCLPRALQILCKPRSIFIKHLR